MSDLSFAVLGSGSKGNAVLVRSAGTVVMVDCGYGPRTIKERFGLLGLEPGAVRGICVTHAHGDHTKGLKRFAETFRVPVYCTAETAVATSKRSGMPAHVPIETEVPYWIRDQRWTAFATSHDVKGSVGFRVECGTASLGIFTDLGCGTPAVVRGIADASALYFEFNHDENMLWNGPYTHRLKRRVASPRGHLSNADAAALVASVAHAGLEWVSLAHLSEVNNTPHLALEAAGQLGPNVQAWVAPQRMPSEWYPIQGHHATPVVRDDGGMPHVHADAGDDAPQSDARRREPRGARGAGEPRRSVVEPALPLAAGPRRSLIDPARARPESAHKSIAMRRQMLLFGGER